MVLNRSILQKVLLYGLWLRLFTFHIVLRDESDAPGKLASGSLKLFMPKQGRPTELAEESSCSSLGRAWPCRWWTYLSICRDAVPWSQATGHVAAYAASYREVTAACSAHATPALCTAAHATPGIGATVATAIPSHVVHRGHSDTFLRFLNSFPKLPTWSLPRPVISAPWRIWTPQMIRATTKQDSLAWLEPWVASSHPTSPRH